MRLHLWLQGAGRPAGSRELQQFFEKSEPLIARPEWNNLQVRLSQPANITTANALDVSTIHIVGTAANLRKGDKLVLVFDDEGYAIVAGLPPGEARLVLAPRLPANESTKP